MEEHFILMAMGGFFVLLISGAAGKGRIIMTHSPPDRM